jgi:hypothetical protein
LQGGTAGTSTIYTNNTSAKVNVKTPLFDFVDNSYSDVDGSGDKGWHSNFTAQQYGPDSIYDTLTEANTGINDCYPTGYNLLGSTQYVSGSLTDLQSDNTEYMQFRSYSSASTQNNFGYETIGASTANIEDIITGSVFTITVGGTADSITVALSRGTTWVDRNARCAIYKHADLSLVGQTEVKLITLTTTATWYTFNFLAPKPNLTADTDYILVAWSNAGTGYVYMHFNAGATDQGHTQALDYSDMGGAFPNPLVPTHDNNMYSIYCTYTTSSECTSEVEFTGTSNTESWTSLEWTIDSCFTTTTVTATFQLYNYDSGAYPTSGDGYMTDTIGTTDVTKSQTITTNPTYFRDASGNWKMKIKGVKSTASQFDWKADFILYRTEVTNYELDLEVQWTDIAALLPNEELCIYGGTMGSEDIKVDVWNGSAWENVFTDLSTGWNNVSITSYLNSSTFTIRFKGGTETGDTNQDSWNIDATILHVWTEEYDYVLKVVNQVANNWKVNLKVYDSSNISRLSSLNISLHDGTSSNQIAVSAGSIVKSEGEPYNLPGGVNSTIYISISNLQATNSEKSYLYVYLKILVPNTSTYSLFIITFEIR